jgi:WD40 repeat protein
VKYFLFNTKKKKKTEYFKPTSVQFSKNQKYLLSGGKDGTIRIWELTTGIN